MVHEWCKSGVKVVYWCCMIGIWVKHVRCTWDVLVVHEGCIGGA